MPQAEDGIEQVLHAMSDLTIMVGDISANADAVAKLTRMQYTLQRKALNMPVKQIREWRASQSHHQKLSI